MEAQKGQQLILVKTDAGGRFGLRCLLFFLEGQRSYQPLQLPQARRVETVYPADRRCGCLLGPTPAPGHWRLGSTAFLTERKKKD